MKGRRGSAPTLAQDRGMAGRRWEGGAAEDWEGGQGEWEEAEPLKGERGERGENRAKTQPRESFRHWKSGSQSYRCVG